MDARKLFLYVDGITTPEGALQWAVNAAVQRNHVYSAEATEDSQEKFKEKWKALIIREAENYRDCQSLVSDEQHCDAISRVADELSYHHGETLSGSRLRFGTSQKALNLYLKYLWALGELKGEAPPHCPIDRGVLDRCGLLGSWTQSDNREEYMGWIRAIRSRLNLTAWENEIWLRERLHTLRIE